jgi:hypothetical protein
MDLEDDHTYEVMQKASVVTVHALRAGNLAIAKHFGELTGDDVEYVAGRVAMAVT